jgi:hypothetical protein
LAIIFLSGVGATGKTSVVNEFQKNSPEYFTMPSVTRLVYKKLGIASEKSALSMSSAEQITLQQAIFFTYLEEVRKLVSCNSNVLIDRSPIDHWSYFVSKNLDKLSGNSVESRKYKQLENLRETLSIALLEELNFKHCSLLLVKFPFPNSWNLKTVESSDGFRNDTNENNLVWDNELNRCIVNCRTKLSFYLRTNILEPNVDTSYQRYQSILKHLRETNT